tara:strand:+ start:157 stop:606 length:450 start_codon:yes stop_codon:yes gene_type:complete
MAIARGAGTEIIRAHHLESVGTTDEELIYGVAHHIYTVLSVVVFAAALNADTDWVRCYLVGYDSAGGTAAQTINIFQQDMSVAQTYVWNDKFSFNGNEPTDFTAGIDSVAKQDAIADQAQATAQILKIVGEHGSDSFDVTCTFIDQNNA